MHPRTLKRKQPPKNAHADFRVSDSAKKSAAIGPGRATYRHDMVEPNAMGSAMGSSQYFSLPSSESQVAATESFSIPPENSFPDQNDSYSHAMLDDNIDIVDYATSGNFDHADFVTDTFSSEVQETGPQETHTRDEVREHLVSFEFT
jgi:hypothetical protein